MNSTELPKILDEWSLEVNHEKSLLFERMSNECGKISGCLKMTESQNYMYVSLSSE